MTSSASPEIIHINRSKSLLIRMMIASFLNNKRTFKVNENENDSEDVKTVARALSTMRDGTAASPTVVDARDCGAAYRFLLAVAAVTDGEWLLTGSTRLRQRPIAPLVECLRTAGAHISELPNGWLINGRRLHAEELTIDCSLSSQFASALILISDRIGLRKLNITPTPPPSSPYIEMTRRVVEQIRIGRSIEPEADWSSAAFWYAFAATAPEHIALLLKDLRLNSIQGDRITADIFKGLGVSSTQEEDGVLIRNDVLHSQTRLRIDLRDHPDLAPVLAATAVLYPLDMEICGLENLNHKESHRLDHLREMLSPFAPVATDGISTLQIKGRSRKESLSSPILTHTHNDHRMVMAAALLAQFYCIEIDDITCVKKSYPDFMEYGYLLNNKRTL